jgi:hypothetical protein
MYCIARQQDRGAQDDRGHQHRRNLPHHQWRLCRHRRGVHQGHTHTNKHTHTHTYTHTHTHTHTHIKVTCYHTPLYSIRNSLYFLIPYETHFTLPFYYIMVTCYHTLLYIRTCSLTIRHFTLLYCMLFCALLYSTLLYVCQVL